VGVTPRTQDITQPITEQPEIVRVSRRLTDGRLAFLFIAPTLLLLFWISIFPLLWSLGLSFHRYQANQPLRAPVFIGFTNYGRVTENMEVWRAFQTTAGFVLGAVVVETLLGFGIALLLNRKFPGRGLILTLMLLPMMLSPAIVALFWRYMYEPQWGVINYYIKAWLGMPPVEWLVWDRTILLSLVIVDVWQWTPFMLLISLAGLSAVPRYLYEAAEVDRASAWFKFRHITLPLVWPLILIAMIFRTMDALRVFEAPYIMSAGKRAGETIAVTLYRLAFQQWETGLSTALAYIVLVMIIALANIYIRYLTKATSR